MQMTRFQGLAVAMATKCPMVDKDKPPPPKIQTPPPEIGSSSVKNF